MYVYPGKSPARDGYLKHNLEYEIHTVANPVVDGSEVGKTLKGKIWKWADKRAIPLFRKPKLRVRDFYQERVSDCWYVAAMIAMANHAQGSTIIKRIMVDCHDGHALVRLFDKTRKPIYLKIEKSAIWFLGFGKVHTSLAKGTGSWPLMLEKAACSMDKADDWGSVSTPAKYLNIEGGHSQHAFRMLTGCEVDCIDISSMNLEGAGDSTDQLSYLFELLWGMTYEDYQPTPKHIQGVEAVFGRGSSMTAVKWREHFLRACAKENPSGPGWLKTKAYEALDLNSVPWQYRFFTFLSRSRLPRRVQDVLKQFFNDNNMRAGAVGTSTYSGGALDLFELVKKNLRDQKPMCFGTQKDIGRSEGKGKSGGESMVRGMVAKHAYAVLDVQEGTVKTRTRKFIKAANPWGCYGRTYVKAKPGPGVIRGSLVATSGGKGSFLLELTDFINMAEQLYVCKQNPLVGNREFKSGSKK